MGSLHDAYELGGVAGRGRTTVVRLAVRRADARPVALKQLRPEHAEDPDKRARFLEQARRAALLHHECIETVFAVLDDEEPPVAITEWVDGRSLERLLVGNRRYRQHWPPSVIVLIARSLLEALRQAHHQMTEFDRQGMLHGGVRPGNVLITIDGEVKLVDFGLASVREESREPWQDLEALRYLSADHVRHGPSAEGDLFGVGAIVHEMIDGRRFRHQYETEAEMRVAIERGEPPPPPRSAVEIPSQLERLRLRLLEPVHNPRLMLEHMLDVCATVPLTGARASLRRMVREALRRDSTAPDMGPDSEPPQDSPRSRPRSRTRAHAAAGAKLERTPIAHQSRARDTASVPIPVDHEQTAARRPMFLQQTSPPVGAAARDAEQRRAGARTVASQNDDVDTAPIGLDDVERAALDAAADEVEAIAEWPAMEPEPRPSDFAALADPGVTAEVDKIPLLPEQREAEANAKRTPTRGDGPASGNTPSWPRWLRGPLGLVLLGAVVVGLGLPLVSRCSADAPEPTQTRRGPKSTPSRDAAPGMRRAAP